MLCFQGEWKEKNQPVSKEDDKLFAFAKGLGEEADSQEVSPRQCRYTILAV